MALLNVTSSDTSLADLGQNRIALLICAAPSLSANKPDRIVGSIVLRVGNAVSTALRAVNRVGTRSDCLVGVDLPRLPALRYRIPNQPRLFRLNGADSWLRFLGVLAKPEFLRRFAVDDSGYSELS